MTNWRQFIDAFPSPEELWDRTFEEKNDWFLRFSEIPFEDKNGTMQVRYYQEIAVNRVAESIAKGQKKILLTLATGTGKTFIAFQIAWKLFKSRWTLQGTSARQPRILFLTDRNFLADQGLLGFSGFQEDSLRRVKPKEIAKENEELKSQMEVRENID